MSSTIKSTIVETTAPRPCSEVVPIIPFRYAIMPKEIGDKTKQYYDKCPTNWTKALTH